MCGKTGVKQVFMERKERYTVVDLAKKSFIMVEKGA